jgi:hypothetical protein
MAKRNAKHKTIHLVAATIFGIVTFVHALRLAYRTPILIGSWELPVWLSWIGVFLAGSLAVLLWQSANKK